MAVFNGFPATYQPMMYQPQQPMVYPQQQQVQPQQQNNNSIIWVQGEAGAKSYLVAPNNTVQLWDSENQVIYLKSADASGMPSIKTLDYTIRQEQQQHPVQLDNKTFAYQQDLDSMRHQLEALSDEFHRYVDTVERPKERKSKNE